MQLKLLFFDIETAPLLAHIWHPGQGWVSADQTSADTFILTWAAKWAGAKKIYSARLTSAEAKKQDDLRLVTELADMIRQADVIAAHNLKRFDLKKVRQRILMNDLEPLPVVSTIDTLVYARKDFGFAHNKLDYLAQELGVGQKIDTDMDLWIRAYHGDVKALKEMERYNRHDVVLLEGVFDKMRPHVTRLTRLYEADRDWEYICPNCGAEGVQNFVVRKYYRTQAGTFPQYQCKECKRYHRGRISIKSKRTKLYPL